MSPKAPDKCVSEHALHVFHVIGKDEFELRTAGHSTDTLARETAAGRLTRGVDTGICHRINPNKFYSKLVIIISRNQNQKWKQYIYYQEMDSSIIPIIFFNITILIHVNLYFFSPLRHNET